SSSEIIEGGLKASLVDYGRFTSLVSRDDMEDSLRRGYIKAASDPWFSLAMKALEKAEKAGLLLNYGESCITCPLVLAFKTMPKIYTPPSIRTLYS
ncbi:hypothetical protein PENTCL1PPCAC_19878, partial [Pristionchus entomophagus]